MTGSLAARLDCVWLAISSAGLGRLNGCRPLAAVS